MSSAIIAPSIDSAFEQSDLPAPFNEWLRLKSWKLRIHQVEMIHRASDQSILLVAPTGSGKTLAGFLPSLIDINASQPTGLHTLYVSPLKALAADIRRNLETPVNEMNLPIRVETRTADTKQHQRRVQRFNPPHILLTTPESLALMLSYPEAPNIFSTLQRVVLDEIHALVESKRGEQLMLCIARLKTYSPNLRFVGLSATVRNPATIAAYLSIGSTHCSIVHSERGPQPQVQMLMTTKPPPWSGSGGRYAATDVMKAIESAQTTLVFINTRAQAELFFQALWQANEKALPISIHHGSLSREARLKVEAAMTMGKLRAVVCTGTLDLGLDWGNVDLVIQIGSPKEVKRLVQRIGRSNHRYDTPSRALLVAANSFEILECKAALEAVQEDDLDPERQTPASIDVICQHIMITACSAPFCADSLFNEIRSVGKFKRLTRSEFDDCLNFCSTGGYALRAYDRWKRIKQNDDKKWHLRDLRIARVIRMNIGTIVESEKLKVKLSKERGGKPLGEVEEYFASQLTPGDTFLLGGETVCFEAIRELQVEVRRTPSREPKIAVYSGTKFASSTILCRRILQILLQDRWPDLPRHIQDWISVQKKVSALPNYSRMLVESFQLAGREYTCFYGFAGRNAMMTLGLILTLRMEEADLKPLGFVPSDYALLVWSLNRVNDPATLMNAHCMRDQLDTWLTGNAVMKRTFRNIAEISGLVEKSVPGRRKTGRQMTVSTDIIYDTLCKYDPNHLLLRITREQAMQGLVDYSRIEEMFNRYGNSFQHLQCDGPTPFAAPLMLEAGRIPIRGKADEQLLRDISELLNSKVNKGILPASD